VTIRQAAWSGDADRMDRDLERVDMNPQCVMMACRDYLWTGDKDYLVELSCAYPITANFAVTLRPCVPLARLGPLVPLAPSARCPTSGSAGIAPS
jgi:hypothetical protein